MQQYVENNSNIYRYLSTFVLQPYSYHQFYSVSLLSILRTLVVLRLEYSNTVYCRTTGTISIIPVRLSFTSQQTLILVFLLLVWRGPDRLLFRSNDLRVAVCR
jgi:hypothetical protein